MQQQQYHSVYSNTDRSQQNWLMFPFLKWFPSTHPKPPFYPPRTVFPQPLGASNLCNCRQFWPPGAQICATVVNSGPRGLRSVQLSSIMALRILPGGSLPGEPQPSFKHQSSIKQAPINHQSTVNQLSNNHLSTLNQPSINRQRRGPAAEAEP